MKLSMVKILILSLAMSLASCTFLDELLNVNLFAESMELSNSDVQNLGISQLLEKSDSNAFYTTVGGDSTLKAAVLNKTSAVINDGEATPLAIQEAGILGANVLIYTSPAGELLANAAKLADGVEEEATMDEVLALILPASIYNGGTVVDEDAFLAMITAFQDANEYFIAIGTSLVAGDGGYATSAANAGDIALGSFIGAVLGSVIVPDGGDLGQYLLDALNGDSVAAPDFSIPDDPYLEAILNAANLGSLLDL